MIAAIIEAREQRHRSDEGLALRQWLYPRGTRSPLWCC
jgi:hypothetical protein